MSAIIDLHCHSTISDGMYSPEELVAYAHQQSSSAQVRSWLSLLVASAELFRGEVAEALLAKIARLETEDQQAVVTELRTQEQGLVGDNQNIKKMFIFVNCWHTYTQYRVPRITL